MKIMQLQFTVLAFYLLLNSVVQAWSVEGPNTILTPEIQTILNNSLVEKEQSSPDRKSKATLYRSNKSLGEGEIADEVLQITSLDDAVWMYEGYGLMFYKFKFISNSHLIMTICSSTACGTTIFNNKTNTITQLGGGEYTLIDSGKIKLSGSKFYDDSGAFWVNKIVDYDGNLIEVLSSDSKYWGCISLKEILNNQAKDKRPKLKQSMNDCVYVDR